MLENVVHALRRQAKSLTAAGLALGTLFFAASLTPSLIPRNALTQGALAGGCFAIGYGLGVFLRWLWRYLELPELAPRTRLLATIVTAVLCVAIAALFLWWATDWQNSIRTAFGMEPVESARPFTLFGVSIATFLALYFLAYMFKLLALGVFRYSQRYIPVKVAKVVAITVAALLFWSIASRVFFRAAFAALEFSFRQYDALLEPTRKQPTDARKTGSPASLVNWRELGRAGREFVASGPPAQQISTLSGRPAMEPIRVYVGLQGGRTAQERAKLALGELKRQGGFSRSVLIVIMPTGSGWIDPAAINSVEYLHEGDIASVAIQYSYLNSPLSLLVQPEYGAEAGRALFAEIYRYWTAMPKDKRPRLYVHGLSLGALNSARSFDLFDIIGDPIAGAVWSGPPFASRVWRSITDGRNDGSPMWLPEFRDSRFVRFMNQNGSPAPADSPWGPMRVVYLQYASDAITFFDPRDAFRRPAWMDAPIGPDVSPKLRWFPIVTMLQLAVDMPMAMQAPLGYGHVFAPEHYVDAWVTATDVRTWTPESLAKLKRFLGEEARRAIRDGDGPYDDRGG